MLSPLVPAAISAAAAAGVTAAICRPLLTRLPEPTEELEAEAAERQAAEEADARGERFRRTLPQVEAPKILYKDLPTPRFVAVTTALAFIFAGVSGWRLDWSAELIAWGVFSVAAALLLTIDLRTYMLPYVIVWSCEAVVATTWIVAAIVRSQYDPLWQALGCALGAWLVFGLLWLIMPAGVGGGDLRLSRLLGLVLGWLGITVATAGIGFGFFLGAIGGGILVAAKVFSRSGFPYGPFLLLGAFLALALRPVLPI